MRPGPVLLLLTLSLSAALQAEESPPQSLAAASSAQAQAATVEQRPTIGEEQSATLASELPANAGERENVQLQRLRQENQRLKLQLKKALAQAPHPLISEQQLWFAIGAAAGLLGVIVGALLRSNRRSRREWLN
ncbi:translation initiation factor 2 [Pseudomonas sp.]|uniref:translation initiation factor 2 n=1 Tax=Pseudomonas sp. TaxID=306 RepID=UPI0027356F2E|nr:translation initiation factor 2 [Pseudomonas sp.]MDP3816477.1 translation initiation factor 2 [Pseudomonas sp.]